MGSKKVILVADSDDSQNQLLSIQLKKLDFEVDQVFDMESLVSAAKTRRYALIFVEATMERSSAAAIKTIRNHEAAEGLARIPMIAVSKDSNDEQTMLTAGCDEFLKRPIEQRKLKAVIKSWCS